MTKIGKKISEYGEALRKTEGRILNYNLVNIVKETLQQFKPKSKTDIIEWAEKNIILDDTNPIPGPFRIKNSIHLKEIFEAVQDPLVKEITIMGSAQIAKTLFVQILWAYWVDQDPSPVLIMQPTDREVKSFAVHKLERMIEASPILKEKVADKKKGSSTDSSTRLKMYKGGWTEIISGTSRGTTRQRSVRRTIADDIDMMDITKVTEGDHLKNLKKRTTAFKYNRLNIELSTPRIEGQSKIEQSFNEGSRGRYAVECPHCKHIGIWTEDNLHWVKEKDLLGKVIENKIETVTIMCTHCGTTYTERERLEILYNGKYIHEKENKTHKSFWINQLMSTLATVQSIVDEKIKAEYADDNGDDSLLESYTNNTLGLPYKKNEGKKTDSKHLIDRREDYIKGDNKIPDGVLLITSACDVQAGGKERPARLEVETWGWGIGEECWILDKKVFVGELEKEEIWNKLDNYWSNAIYTRIDGVELKISMNGIDSGYLPETVYSFIATKKWQQKKYLALKGANKYGAPLVPRKFTKVYHDRVQLFIIGTQTAKHQIYERLNTVLEHGKKYIHTTKAFCDVEYYEQLTAEQMVTKRSGLTQYTIFEKKKRTSSNEALDLIVYNYALMRALAPNFPLIQNSIEVFKEKEVKDPESEKTSTTNHDIQKKSKIIIRSNKANVGYL